MLLSGTGNPELSERIAREIDLPLAPMDITASRTGSSTSRSTSRSGATTSS